jgi:hypothetical protein
MTHPQRIPINCSTSDLPRVDEKSACRCTVSRSTPLTFTLADNLESTAQLLRSGFDALVVCPICEPGDIHCEREN